MALNNRLLTWENLQRRGWEGPSRFSLCGINAEIGPQLFFFCSYAESVWNKSVSKFTMVQLEAIDSVLSHMNNGGAILG